MQRYDFNSASKFLKIDLGFSLNDNYIDVEGDIEQYSNLSIIKYGNRTNLTGNIITVKSSLIRLQVSIGDDNCSLNIDENVSGRVDITLWRNGSVHIGEDTSINEARIIADYSDVHIGKDCLLSDGILIQSNDQHGLFDLSSGLMMNCGRRGIFIEDHVWIGRRVTLMPDTFIGQGSVLSTCAVVTKDVPAFTYAAGVPARIVREAASWFRSPSGPNEKETMFFSANGFENILKTNAYRKI